MIMKTLFLGVFGLAFVLGKTSAQFVHHHQQIFYHEDSDRREWHTKALTPVGREWAFASTIRSDDNEKLRILLAKLGANRPFSSAFQFDWAMEYDANAQAIDVMDVYADDDDFYILCGKLLKNDRSLAFLLKTDADGVPITAKTYSQFSEFNSVVPKAKGRGYITVGRTRYASADNPQTAAAYVGVDDDLEPQCASTVRGQFEDQDSLGTRTDNIFNKVIHFKGNAYAVVGETKSTATSSTCRANSDVLVMVANHKCKVKWVKQYGNQDFSPNDGGEISERGLSIAKLPDAKPKGLIVTGNTKKQFCKDTTFDDILAFRLKPRGDVMWWGHYHVDPDLAAEVPDVGTAVQVTSKLDVLVAGETETTYFPTPNETPTTDAFLLSLKKGSGEVKNIDVFGLDEGIENGALSPGNLDLHLSREEYAVMMGNAQLRNNIVHDQPYLIERYPKREEQCFDVREKIEKGEYDYKITPLKANGMDVVAKRLRFKYEDYKLRQDTVCEKIEA